MFSSPVDIVIPLGNGSCCDNFELRMALRSIASCARHCGKIYVITDTVPQWLCNTNVIIQSDRHTRNKDANIIEKLLTAVNLSDLSEKFIFWSDDQLALESFSCRGLLPIYNRRQRSDFSGTKIWHRRMCNTFDYLAQQKCFLHWNWESHTPQIMDKNLFRKLVTPVDYIQSPGLGVNTLYFGLAATPPLLEQSQVKATFESPAALMQLPADKLFIGYNDAALRGNLASLLLKFFPEKCRYEKSDLPDKVIYLK
jgi:hypothetical protein